MKARIATIEPGNAKLIRNLDGKGRLILPGDFREAAGFTPDEPVEVELVSVGGRTGFLITAAFKEENQ
ncbi:hypothetical protein BRYFOR_07513 [Marvinbryantia formatexigens DSM 14469]|uniref:SpoVT-AbrB domain-containing protein n=1 Tax=Marvinbryantia formatexigens DSM 14469 TaxID=478749 RepID=C6LFV3_9FIRM|nr:AbrB family transcriptional regulator [Marvinbryantia formatexigens]EET60317.1 hypothetical protein BRYFOR_07513 [Marvinbryantia formatexigens DSM 14469]UWO25343.1 division/cell wall cluster transcriptional repressor MraZ [Marvinbryantia formatexigens DSM 14469]SDH00073.1 MraZ protein, putative antitoxin-like [Marvinbryantia formatexigens]